MRYSREETEMYQKVVIMSSSLFARSISSPLLLSRTKFVSNRKQGSAKKVKMLSGIYTKSLLFLVLLLKVLVREL